MINDWSTKIQKWLFLLMFWMQFRVSYKFYVLRCLVRTFPVEVRHVYGFGLLHSSKSALLEISQNQEEKKKEQIHIIICVVVSQETILVFAFVFIEFCKNFKQKVILHNG